MLDASDTWSPRPARGVLLGCLALLAVLPGCLLERSFPMVPERLVRLNHAVAPRAGRLNTRDWAAIMHGAARSRLPARSQVALTSADLARRGEPGEGGQEPVVDVWRYFAVDPARVDSLWHNWEGIEQTAQVISTAPEMESGHIRRNAWAGFTDVELPGTRGAMLFARLGIPEDQHRIPGSAVIITHGLFGSLDGTDMLNHVQALRRAGHVVLALEMRGHGETHCRHPEYAITFGMYEAGDLVEAAQWLKRTAGVRRVGLVSFSLTGYESLLTAWLDGHRAVTEFDEIPAFAALPKPGPQPAFSGGILVVSAPVGILQVADEFEPRVSPLEAPCKGTFQKHVAARLAFYKDPPGHGMWDLARYELTRAGFIKDVAMLDEFRTQFSRFIDLSAESWNLGAARMENVRVPLLVLHAANDPLATAQGIAELFGRVRNPNVGVMLLRQGGHMGFSALSADYYYSVMVNFFDPATAPVAASAVNGLVRGIGR